VEVSNYVSALEHGMQRLEGGFPLSNRLLRELHEILLQSGRGAEKQPGEFRRTQNWIGGTRPGNAHFVPTPPDQLQDCMGALERFIHARDDMPVLVRAALAHVQFETIHPFLDGNGRVGRLLIALILHESAVLAQPLLYLSLYFKQHRAEYYRLLDTVRRTGDWEAWLDFFLEGVAETAEGAVTSAQRLLNLLRTDEARVHGQSASTQKVFAALRERPYTTIRDMEKRCDISFPTASAAIDALVRLNILRELTGNERNRVFAYEQYLAILREGDEPLRQ
jgi:Fic family protein